MNEPSLWLLGIELVLLVMFAVGHSSNGRGKNGRGRDLGVYMLAAAGAMLVAVARDVVVLFAALELVSGCTWMLVYCQRACSADENGSAVELTAGELTTRHVLLSLVGSALLLMGLAIICGTSGTIDLRAMDLRAINVGSSNGMHLAVALIFAGLGIRVGLVPFAVHLPNTCRSITSMGAMMLLVAPWIAGAIALTQLMASVWPGLEGICWPVPWLLAVVSMCYASLAMVGEQNVRRLGAYMLMAQGGFILIGTAAALSQAAMPESSVGELLASGALGGVLFYILAIVPSVIGALGILVYLGREDGEIDIVDELAGLGRSRPWIAAAIALFMLSLAGMPPLSGFWARVAVLMPIVTIALTANSSQVWWFVALIVMAGCSTVLMMVVCARLMVVMYFRLPLATPQTRGGRTAAAAIIGCAVLTILIGLFFLR